MRPCFQVSEAMFFITPIDHEPSNGSIFSSIVVDDWQNIDVIDPVLHILLEQKIHGSIAEFWDTSHVPKDVDVTNPVCCQRYLALICKFGVRATGGQPVKECSKDFWVGIWQHDWLPILRSPLCFQRIGEVSGIVLEQSLVDCECTLRATLLDDDMYRITIIVPAAHLANRYSVGNYW